MDEIWVSPITTAMRSARTLYGSCKSWKESKKINLPEIPTG